jgi:fatty acid desaturase
MATTMVPPISALPDVLPTERLNARGMPRPAVRDELRRIPNVRNAVATAGALAQTFGLIALAIVVDRWWMWLIAFLLMGRGHALLNILAHEAAHRLLFTNRAINDFTGRWLLGYPSFQAFGAYRRVHFAHHRDELGPDEPDTDLYRGYPIPVDSWRRKLRRDLTGESAYKNLKALLRAARHGAVEARQIVAVQVVLLAISLLLREPLAYLLWIGSWSTLWKFSNRLRAIAEHGGMERSRDRRRTTHVIRQSPIVRFCMVPYNTGWHLAHHVDMGVPWTKLPALHRELVASGWVVPDIEYRTYRDFWRACSSGETA